VRTEDGYGVQVNASRNSLFTEVYLYTQNQSTLYGDDASTYNTYSHLRSHGDDEGMYVEGAHNVLHDLFVTGHYGDGLWVYGEGQTVANVVVSESTGRGVGSWSRNAVHLNTLVSAVGWDGMVVSGFSGRGNGVHMNETVLRADGSYGMWIEDAGGHYVDGVVLANNRYNLLVNRNANGNVFRDLVSVDTIDNFGLEIYTENNLFVGTLKVGNNGTNCVIGGTLTAPGLSGPDCAASNGSSAVVTTNNTSANSFVGPISSDDIFNLSDNNPQDTVPAGGQAELLNILDWFGFENAYRTWGVDEGYPTVVGVDYCSGVCRIWDWSLSSSDDNVPGPLLHAQRALPTGTDTRTHVWAGDAAPTSQADCDAIRRDSTFNAPASRCETTFLLNATELFGDHIGNEDGLCNSDEHCLYTPNLGAYQGHGPLVPAGSVNTGNVTGVTLWAHTHNGY
jgi:hypothetical protein